MTRRKAIKEFYRWLHNGSPGSVRACTMYGHSLYPYRTGHRRDDRPADGVRKPCPVSGNDFRFDPPLQPAKAIRAACLDCRGSCSAVRRCPHEGCPLWEYRLKRRPRKPKSTPAGEENPT